MAIDTFMVFVGVYADVDGRGGRLRADQGPAHRSGPDRRLRCGGDPARDDGKVKIVRKHETPTRVGGVLGGGVGLATGLVVALFPFAAIGGGLLAATAAGGPCWVRWRGTPLRG